MKRFLSMALLALALARPAFSQPSSEFINNGTISSPIVIDATNFINNGLFDIAFNNFSSSGSSVLLITTALSPFDFSDVLYYTNRGVMAADTGFIFDTAPSTGGSRHRAGSFGNANIGQISVGSATNTFFGGIVFFVGSGGLSQTGTPTLTVSATNIVNAGLLDSGVNGLISLAGGTVNLARGSVHIEGLDDFSSIGSVNIDGGILAGTSLDFGVFDNYWGVGIETNQLKIGNFGVPPQADTSSNHKVTFYPAGNGKVTVSPPNPEAFVYANQVNVSNTTYQIVFVNTNIVANGVIPAVGFAPNQGNGFGVPVVQWSAVVTNPSTLVVSTNTLYLLDTFGSDTNFALTTNGYSLTGQLQLSPTNYTITRSFPGIGQFGSFSSLSPGNETYDGTQFNGAFSTNKPLSTTNQYAAYGVNIQAVTATPDPASSVSSITNVPGRIVITADQYLDLTRSKITGPNYVSLMSTNHFAGSSNADLIYPFADINLGTTNGMLTVSNLVAPYVPRFEGTIDIYSARWTNIDALGNTNEYHVLMVDAEIVPTSPVQLNNLSLRSTNVVISDLLNVASNLLLNATTVTITSNACGAATPVGQLNLLTSDIIWNPSFPVLQYFTNSGIVSIPNTVYFAGVRQNPYYTSNFTEPYQSFVNHGSISSSGASIWANYFENTGANSGIVTNCAGVVTNNTNFAVITSTFGPFNLQSATALMANGAISASSIGDINITSGSLSVSNHYLIANGAITLVITNLLTDTGTNSSNFWQVGDGINLPIKPTTGDLLGTTIDSICSAGAEVDNQWAGIDRGANAAGFLNNAAMGHLILDGGDTNSTFLFTGAGATNAIYVDLLELRDGATNRADNGQGIPTFTAIDVSPGMTVYFADAIMPGNDISEKLNGQPTQSGGNLVWVPSYAGFFSSTNITYPSGRTYTFNRALVESTDIDSNGNGTPNASDSTPIFVGEDINLSLSFTNNPGRSIVVSWQTLAGATNNLFSNTNLTGTNWVLVTNFVSTMTGTVAVTNGVQPGVPRYYEVRVDPPQQ